MNTASLKQDYQDRIVPILMKEFGYTTVMQCPKLTKIVLNQGLGDAVADKKIIDVAQQEMTLISGQKAVATVSKKDIANFKVRKKMPIGITEQIIFPEINIDTITKLMGMNITFVTTAPTDAEGFALLREFGLPFKK